MTRSGHNRSAARPLRGSVRGRTLVAALAALGGAAVVAGAALPWLTVFNGLKSYSGALGRNGQLLMGGGGVAIALALWYGIRGRSGVRYALGALGFVLALFSAYLVAQLLLAYRSLEGMFLPALGPGVFLAAAGALLIMATLLIDTNAKPAEKRAGWIDVNVATLVALSAGAGTIHLAVAADHLHEYVLFGLFFIALGIAQVGWAALIALLGPSRPLLIAATANAAVVALWAFSRTTGLPLGPSPGVPEAIGFPDVMASLFEGVLVAYVLVSLRLPRHKPRSKVAPLAWAFPLLVSPATIAAVLAAVGAATFGIAAGAAAKGRGAVEARNGTAIVTVGPGPVTTSLSTHGYGLSLRLKPNRATVAGTITLTLTRRSHPVAGARVRLTFTMLDMDMGGLTVLLPETAPGRYGQAGAILGMSGRWGLRLDVAPPHATRFSAQLIDRIGV